MKEMATEPDARPADLAEDLLYFRARMAEFGVRVTLPAEPTGDDRAEPLNIPGASLSEFILRDRGGN